MRSHLLNIAKMEVLAKKKLEKLRGQLKGHYSEVAKRCGVQVSTVSRVLNGDFENDNVLEEAIKVRDEVVSKKLAIISKI